MARPEYRIIFLDDGKEYLKHSGWDNEYEARKVMKNIAPSRRPQLLRVIAGQPPGIPDYCSFHGTKRNPNCHLCRALEKKQDQENGQW